MANQKTVAAKPNFFVRAWNAIKKFFVRIAKSFRNMFFELKKVTWPSKSDMVNYCWVIFVFIMIMGVIIGLFDLGASSLINLIVS